MFDRFCVGFADVEPVLVGFGSVWIGFLNGKKCAFLVLGVF